MMQTDRGDHITSIKRRRRDLSRDVIEDLTTASGRNRLQLDLEDLTPSHEGYRNTIELPEGNNVVPLRFDTIRKRTRFRLFQFSLRDKARNWLERLPAGSISTWEDLTTRFLAQFFPPGRTAKLHNDILMFQQHQGESLSDVL
ncbi:zinc finger, CCHC-type containing protein [Tanacetum coccineum]